MSWLTRACWSSVTSGAVGLFTASKSTSDSLSELRSYNFPNKSIVIEKNSSIISGFHSKWQSCWYSIHIMTSEYIPTHCYNVRSALDHPSNHFRPQCMQSNRPALYTNRRTRAHAYHSSQRVHRIWAQNSSLDHSRATKSPAMQIQTHTLNQATAAPLFYSHACIWICRAVCAVQCSMYRPRPQIARCSPCSTMTTTCSAWMCLSPKWHDSRSIVVDNQPNSSTDVNAFPWRYWVAYSPGWRNLPH